MADAAWKGEAGEVVAALWDAACDAAPDETPRLEKWDGMTEPQRQAVTSALTSLAVNIVVSARAIALQNDATS